MQLPKIQIERLRQSDMRFCELATYLRLSLPKPMPTGAMTIGSIFHEVVAQFCTAEMSVAQGIALGESKLLKAFQKGSVAWKDKPENLRRRLAAYLYGYLPFAELLRGNLESIERHWELEYRGLILMGTIDSRLTAPIRFNGGELTPTIVDHKTASRLPSVKDYLYSPQTDFYIFAGWYLFGEILPITYCVGVLDRTCANVHLFTVERNKSELITFLSRTYALWLRLQAGNITVRKSFKCRFCEYQKQCLDFGKD